MSAGVMRPITPADHQHGVDWLLERQRSHVSRTVSIGDLHAHLPGLAGMTHAEIVALLGVPASHGPVAIVWVDDVIESWCGLRPGLTEAPR